MKHKTYLIAEIGPNHNGSLDLAMKMISRLAKIGVDAIKFQIAKPENVYSKDSFKPRYQVCNESSKSPIEMAKRHQLSYEEHLKLYHYCRQYNVDYLCSAFDKESLEFLLAQMNLPYLKIASGEIFSIDMMDIISLTDIPVVLSTGMATYEEIEKAVGLVNRYKKKDITILHCISNYPTPPEDVNLKVMVELGRRFSYPYGFSDHTIGNDAAIASVALGATIIEKHVTTDKNLPGPDHKSSLSIEEFAALVTSIRNVEKMMGCIDKSFSDDEIEIRKAARKSLVSKHDLKAGMSLQRSDIVIKRPGFGISPLDINNVIGRRLKNDLEADRVITYDNLI